ncbi:MAG TPA: hypothetical protein VL738_24170 [Dactylosporangium sp.]|jgi:hypothetical protein|nr:hypothetical protein [Dactylosporangium sp.]
MVWEEFRAATAARDAGNEARHGWPRLLGPLVEAAFRTRLSRFYPYFSHHTLRFATVERHWTVFDPEPPASIATVLGDQPEYCVWWGQICGDYERPTLVLQTTDPQEAARLAELLTDAWPFAYPIRPRAAAVREGIFWVEAQA